MWKRFFTKGSTKQNSSHVPAGKSDTELHQNASSKRITNEAKNSNAQGAAKSRWKIAGKNSANDVNSNAQCDLKGGGVRYDVREGDDKCDVDKHDLHYDEREIKECRNVTRAGTTISSPTDTSSTNKAKRANSAGQTLKRFLSFGRKDSETLSEVTAKTKIPVAHNGHSSKRNSDKELAAVRLKQQLTPSADDRLNPLELKSFRAPDVVNDHNIRCDKKSKRLTTHSSSQEDFLDSSFVEYIDQNAGKTGSGIRRHFSEREETWKPYGGVVPLRDSIDDVTRVAVWVHRNWNNNDITDDENNIQSFHSNDHLSTSGGNESILHCAPEIVAPPQLNPPPLPPKIYGGQRRQPVVVKKVSPPRLKRRKKTANVTHTNNNNNNSETSAGPLETNEGQHKPTSAHGVPGEKFGRYFPLPLTSPAETFQKNCQWPDKPLEDDYISLNVLHNINATAPFENGGMSNDLKEISGNSSETIGVGDVSNALRDRADFLFIDSVGDASQNNSRFRCGAQLSSYSIGESTLNSSYHSSSSSGSTATTKSSLQSSPESEDAEGKESGYVTLEDLQAQLTRSSWSSTEERNDEGVISSKKVEDTFHSQPVNLDLDLDTPCVLSAIGSRDMEKRIMTNSLSSYIENGDSGSLNLTFSVKLESKLFRRRLIVLGDQSDESSRLAMGQHTLQFASIPSLCAKPNGSSHFAKTASDLSNAADIKNTSSDKDGFINVSQTVDGSDKYVTLPTFDGRVLDIRQRHQHSTSLRWVDVADQQRAVTNSVDEEFTPGGNRVNVNSCGIRCTCGRILDIMLPEVITAPSRNEALSKLSQNSDSISSFITPKPLAMFSGKQTPINLDTETTFQNNTWTGRGEENYDDFYPSTPAAFERDSENNDVTTVSSTPLLCRRCAMNVSALPEEEDEQSDCDWANTTTNHRSFFETPSQMNHQNYPTVVTPSLMNLSESKERRSVLTASSEFSRQASPVNSIRRDDVICARHRSCLLNDDGSDTCATESSGRNGARSDYKTVSKVACFLILSISTECIELGVFFLCCTTNLLNFTQ